MTLKLSELRAVLAVGWQICKKEEKKGQGNTFMCAYMKCHYSVDWTNQINEIA